MSLIEDGDRSLALRLPILNWLTFCHAICLPMTQQDLYISWSEYHQTIEQLAVQIYRSQWDFDGILCLARGGLRIGDLLSRIYHKPLSILAVSSYGGTDDRLRGKIRFSEDLTTVSPLSGRVLVVDDLVDSGISLQEALTWLEARYGDRLTDIRTAVLWYKAASIFVPDYYVTYLPDNPWIHQPFESYEGTDFAQLVERCDRLEAIGQLS